MKGRKPTPTMLKVLSGNPGKRPLNEREPAAPQGVPEPPEWLDDEAKAEWARVTVDLAAMGLLSQADRPALAAYCTAWISRISSRTPPYRVRNGSKPILV
jgi:phage terminase small subunit